MKSFTNKLIESQEVKTPNWVVSYTKDRGIDFNMSVSSDNIETLIKELKGSMSKSEFDSIYKIELGTL